MGSVGDMISTPGGILSSANAIGLVGGGMWLYKLNNNTATELKELKEEHDKTRAVAAQNQNRINQLTNSVNQLTLNMKTQNKQISKLQKSIDEENLKINKIIKLICSEIEKTNNEFKLPKKYNIKSKNKKHRSFSSEMSEEEYSGEETTQSGNYSGSSESNHKKSKKNKKSKSKKETRKKTKSKKKKRDPNETEEPDYDEVLKKKRERERN
jgi:hypothetical protein